MKTRFFYSMIFVLGLAFMGSTINSANAQVVKKTEKNVQTVKKTENKAHKVVYTCPEHPSVISDKPGKCPKCGMALVEKKEVMKEKKEMKGEMKGEMKSKMDTSKVKHNTKKMEKKMN